MRPEIIDPEDADLSDDELPDFLFSYELSLSASQYMEDLDGCPIWHPNLLDDGNMHEYL